MDNNDLDDDPPLPTVRLEDKSKLSPKKATKFILEKYEIVFHEKRELLKERRIINKENWEMKTLVQKLQFKKIIKF